METEQSRGFVQKKTHIEHSSMCNLKKHAIFLLATVLSPSYPSPLVCTLFRLMNKPLEGKEEINQTLMFGLPV